MAERFLGLGGRGTLYTLGLLSAFLKLRRTRNLRIITIEGMPKTHQVVVEVNMFFNFPFFFFWIFSLTFGL